MNSCEICHLQPKHVARTTRYAWCLPCIIAKGAIYRTEPDGTINVLYVPTDALARYHASTCPNLLMEGSRGTGKSTAGRWDFHMRALAYSGYTYLVLRRTMPELKKSHLQFTNWEMEQLGGFYHNTDNIAMYPNSSRGYYAMAETEADVMKYLSSQFCAIFFDEITTFAWEMVTKISTSARVTEGSGLLAIVRGGTNPLGESAEETQRYYITKDITKEEDPEYDPLDWDSIHLTLEDNPHLDKEQYRKRFAGLSDAYRKAWLDGVWGVEGAYFSVRAEHLLQDMPEVVAHDRSLCALDWPWLHIYRVLDWGWHDQTVCVWIAVLPNGREIPFREKYWTHTTAEAVARSIVEESDELHIVTTFADPSLWIGEKEMNHCLANEFENNGVPLTKSKNDRKAAGYAIQEHLNTLLKDGDPKLQIIENNCPVLLRSLRAMKIDKKIAGRIADHKLDHAPIALGYFCMAGVSPSQIPNKSAIKPWMQPKHGKSRILGSGNVRYKNPGR